MRDMPEIFGTLPDGRAVHRVTLRGGGLTARFLTYGAILQDFRLDGVTFPLVLGADQFSSYLGDMAYSGALVGRFANRIAHGRFTLNGETYKTDVNSLGCHTLHGGSEGSAMMLWRIEEHEADRLVMALDMADGHMGFPGNLTVRVTCSLPGDGVLAMDIEAVSDAATPCSFAQHSYFNLDGGPTIEGHELQVMADRVLPVDADQIPTGEVAPVAGTRFDFNVPRAIGSSGYDHNFCTATEQVSRRPVAVLHSPDSGLRLSVESTEPGLQVYDADHVRCADGLDGRSYGAKSGLALEAQNWPDAVNMPWAPRTILEPSGVYRQSLRYRVSRD